jgi:hypothetical protein
MNSEQAERTLQTIVPTEFVSRVEVIARLRKRLMNLAEHDHCVCETAGRLGIFCRGFKRLADAEFNERVAGIVRKRKGQPRQALEALAGLDHWRRRDAAGAWICCDVETKEHAVCAGWNRFDAATLERFHRALIGSPVQISY